MYLLRECLGGGDLEKENIVAAGMLCGVKEVTPRGVDKIFARLPSEKGEAIGSKARKKKKATKKEMGGRKGKKSALAMIEEGRKVFQTKFARGPRLNRS